MHVLIRKQCESEQYLVCITIANFPITRIKRDAQQLLSIFLSLSLYASPSVCGYVCCVPINMQMHAWDSYFRIGCAALPPHEGPPYDNDDSMYSVVIMG